MPQPAADRQIVVRNRTPNDAPMSWRPVRRDGQPSSAAMFCPSGHYGLLVDHAIHADGLVEPSVRCPVKECDFHANVQLDGWPMFIEETPATARTFRGIRQSPAD